MRKALHDQAFSSLMYVKTSTKQDIGQTIRLIRRYQAIQRTFRYGLVLRL